TGRTTMPLVAPTGAVAVMADMAAAAVDRPTGQTRAQAMAVTSVVAAVKQLTQRRKLAATEDLQGAVVAREERSDPQPAGRGVLAAAVVVDRPGEPAATTAGRAQQPGVAAAVHSAEPFSFATVAR